MAAFELSTPHDFVQNAVKAGVDQNLPEIDEANSSIELGDIEESELLLVTQHFERRFAKNGEVKGWTLRSCVGKHKLVRERGLTTSREPAMISKEYSGRPPPRISSSPGTPVGSLLTFTLTLSFISFGFPQGLSRADLAIAPE